MRESFESGPDFGGDREDAKKETGLEGDVEKEPEFISRKIGHRGACGYEPENTLRSFEKGIELGVDTVELDVYWVDGHLMVHHDDDLDRTTNGSGPIWEKTYEELRELDAGSWFGSESKPAQIPTLEEVLDLVDGRVKVNIELKGEGTAGPVDEVINRYIEEKGRTKDDYLVTSFNREELSKFHEISPDVRIGVASAVEPNAQFAEEMGAYSVSMGAESLTKEFVDDAHERGIKVHVWTVNEPEEIERINAMGADGIFSNYPDRL